MNQKRIAFRQLNFFRQDIPTVCQNIRNLHPQMDKLSGGGCSQKNIETAQERLAALLKTLDSPLGQAMREDASHVLNLLNSSPAAESPFVPTDFLRHLGLAQLYPPGGHISDSFLYTLCLLKLIERVLTQSGDLTLGLLPAQLKGLPHFLQTELISDANPQQVQEAVLAMKFLFSFAYRSGLPKNLENRMDRFCKQQTIRRLLPLIQSYQLPIPQMLQLFPLDYLWEKYFNIYTNMMPQQHVKGPNQDGELYQPSGFDTIGFMLEKIPLSPSDSVIEIGSGPARFANLAGASYPLRRLAALEIDPELAALAAQNAVNNPYLKTPLEVFEGDAATFDPLDFNVFYLFNPFGANTLSQFLKNVLDSQRKKPRTIKLLIQFLCYPQVMAKFPEFTPTRKYKYGWIQLWESSAVRPKGLLRIFSSLKSRQ